jgi:hypothetical protein
MKTLTEKTFKVTRPSETWRVEICKNDYDSQGYYANLVGTAPPFSWQSSMCYGPEEAMDKAQEWLRSLGKVRAQQKK